ncbi:hypothetical protein D8674_036988 [Pyrus ussuriensis x Pyrus communis]|uniref:Uncharacterized protein n=1 Tax=Pyrus ussuriensis x Pyrus communis TaxID=2448454 RepID=A0A5N5GXH5_9ROSA|nr:hypothetical protein D8674_036988 [Pyrus ussuriensis x Pyrus communis]
MFNVVVCLTTGLNVSKKIQAMLLIIPLSVVIKVIAVYMICLCFLSAIPFLEPAFGICVIVLPVVKGILSDAVFFGVHMLRTEHISRNTKSENFLTLLGYEVCVVAVMSTIWYCVGAGSVRVEDKKGFANSTTQTYSGSLTVQKFGSQSPAKSYKDENNSKKLDRGVLCGMYAWEFET